MTSKKNTPESYEACLERRHTEVKGVTKNARTDKLLARQLARADYQRGQCGAPVSG